MGSDAECSWGKQSDLASDLSLGFDSMELPYSAKSLEDLPPFP